MVEIGNKYSAGMRRWNLRMGLTTRCNFRCAYCLPPGKQPVTTEPPLNEIIEVLQAAAAIGIRRVHYTGGEPTVRADFLDIVRAAKEAGFDQQVVTTNGYRLHKVIDQAVENGLTRVIVSLDTLDEQRNLFVTRADHFHDTLHTIERAVELLPTMTKISCCTMRSTLKELPSLVSYAAKLNNSGLKGQVAIKLNQFFPSNPAQLDPQGASYWRDEFVEAEEILDALRAIGELTPVSRKTIDGDNPSYNYYEVGDTGVKVALLAMFSWNYPCGNCAKLRISPQGIATTCISQMNPPVMWGKSLEEKTEILREITSYRMSPKFDEDHPNRRHYRALLGELRFARVEAAPQPIEHFKELLQAKE